MNRGMKVGWIIFLPLTILIIGQSLVVFQTSVMATIAVLIPCSVTFVLEIIETEWSIRKKKRYGKVAAGIYDTQSIFSAISSGAGTIIFLLIIGLNDIEGPWEFVLLGFFIGPFIFSMIATLSVYSISGPPEHHETSYESHFISS